MEASSERRRAERKTTTKPSEIQIGIPQGKRGLQVIQGTLVDVSDRGIGVKTSLPLEVGSRVTVWGGFFAKQPEGERRRRSRVIYCRFENDRAYQAGCAFEDCLDRHTGLEEARAAANGSFVDYYEILQVSPNADSETLQHIYRMLARRYHPDNAETGNQEAFELVLQAYQVLSDAEKRAAYDVEYQAARALRWKIFDQTKSAQGVEGEKRKRLGVLSILYTKMMEQPEKPGVMLREIEELLGCAREHLEFCFWYLKKANLIVGLDNGRYMITVSGVEAVEENGDWKPRPMPPLLDEPQSESAEAYSGQQQE